MGEASPQDEVTAVDASFAPPTPSRGRDSAGIQRRARSVRRADVVRGIDESVAIIVNPVAADLLGTGICRSVPVVAIVAPGEPVAVRVGGVAGPVFTTEEAPEVV